MMGELVGAMQMVRGLGLNVIQYPSKRWGFVGRVPMQLAYRKADGSELTDAEAKDIAQSSNPARTCKHLGVKFLAWETEQEARDAAKAAGFEVAN